MPMQPDFLTVGEPLRRAMTTPEPFVSAAEAAKFLSISRRHLLQLARRGLKGAYALGSAGQRKTYIFRLSELAATVAGGVRK